MFIEAKPVKIVIDDCEIDAIEWKCKYDFKCRNDQECKHCLDCPVYIHENLE